jgi:hypothetical protein
MPTPDTLTPERAERLLAGELPETSREALVAGLVRELRAESPDPPDRLRARVAGLRTPAARRPRRRARVALVLAVLALAAAIAAAALVPRQGSERSADPELASGVDLVQPPAEAPSRWEAGPGSVSYDQDSGEFSAGAEEGPGRFPSEGNVLDPASNRARDVDLDLELRVRNADAVSDAANETMRAVRDVGGHVVSSEVSTEGIEGEARLRVAVPTRRLEDAVVAISALGTVTAQRVQVEDLQRSVDRRSARADALEQAIRRDEIRLGSNALSADERLRVELRLERLRGQLRYAERERARLLREAAFAELTVSLHTREAAKGAAAPQGRIERAARDGLAALASATSVAVFLLVLVGPLLVLAVIAWGFRRRRVRRAYDALLDRPGAEAS